MISSISTPPALHHPHNCNRRRRRHLPPAPTAVATQLKAVGVDIRLQALSRRPGKGLFRCRHPTSKPYLGGPTKTCSGGPRSPTPTFTPPYAFTTTATTITKAYSTNSRRPGKDVLRWSTYADADLPLGEEGESVGGSEPPSPARTPPHDGALPPTPFSIFRL